MATGVVAGAIVSASNFDGAWSEYSNSLTAMVGYLSSGYRSTIIQFSTPDFVGLSESITFAGEGVFTMPTSGIFEVRYAICTSDVNRDAYTNTHLAVSDETQVVAGVEELNLRDVDDTPSKAWSLSVSSARLEPETTYYLVLWAQDVSSTHVAGLMLGLLSTTVMVAYNSGLVYIDTGSGFEAYKCYVDDGTSWNLCIPYIDNGSSWDMSG